MKILHDRNTHKKTHNTPLSKVTRQINWEEKNL